jgi:hypothetical protein
MWRGEAVCGAITTIAVGLIFTAKDTIVIYASVIRISMIMVVILLWITCSGLFSGSEALLLHHSCKRRERNACQYRQLVNHFFSPFQLDLIVYVHSSQGNVGMLIVTW